VTAAIITPIKDVPMADVSLAFKLRSSAREYPAMNSKIMQTKLDIFRAFRKSFIKKNGRMTRTVATVELMKVAATIEIASRADSSCLLPKFR
jgi:hypothetical protein